MGGFVQSYSCITAAGEGVEPLLGALYAGRSYVRDGVARIGEQQFCPSSRDRLENWLSRCLASLPVFKNDGRRRGIVLATTKGLLHDYLPISGDTPNQNGDPIEATLQLLLNKINFVPAEAVAVSHACASSHTALWLANIWLDTGVVDEVLVVAVDEVSEFIEKGFRGLRSLSLSVPRPFAENRDGLALGEGCAMLVLGTSPTAISLGQIAVITEGIALTRPSETGQGLLAACEQVDISDLSFAVAHGTATAANDRAEAAALAARGVRVPVTGTKWCIGHTLGASGLVDAIATCEALRRGEVFALATTQAVDPALSVLPLMQNLRLESPGTRTAALVTSLGFGGVNAALVLQKGGRDGSLD